MTKPERTSDPAFRHFRRRPLRHQRQDILSIAASSKIDDMAQPTSFSFSKARRLTRASEYERVKRDGVVRRGKLLILSATAVENSGLCRVGFVTSRRLGSAVVRNRVRRRLREIVRQHQHDLRQDFWMVLIAKRDAANASYRTLEDEWLRLARRASILL